jgi:protein-S-isoprenylcysteine O-methyltransferase Ste14
VTQGLYSKIRHPIYVFGTLAFLFVVLALQGWPALVIWAIVILIQIARLRREEQVLAETFGSEYTAYRSTTWF